jgi:UDP-3-O-[3-hydroxymyristoyl] glucosamine N-acyltransferase
MKAHEIARHTGCTLEGNGEIEITGLAGIEEAGPGELTFLSNPRYRALLRKTRAAGVFLEAGVDAPPNAAALRSKNPYLAFARAIELFYRRPRRPPGVHPSAVIDPSARLGRDVDAGVTIGDHTEVGANVTLHTGARIGSECVIHAGAVVREHVRLGDRVILQNGAVIGADGFGFAPKGDGTYYKILQSGTVILEDDVEIGANAVVDRATVGATVIGRGTKLDSLVMVGHGCTVGQHTVMAAQTGLAGSTKVGSHVVMAGQVGVAGHLTIGDGVACGGKTGVNHDVPSGTAVMGIPHQPLAQCKKIWAALPYLPEAMRRLRRIEGMLGLRKGKEEG